MSRQTYAEAIVVFYKGSEFLIDLLSPKKHDEYHSNTMTDVFPQEVGSGGLIRSITIRVYCCHVDLGFFQNVGDSYTPTSAAPSARLPVIDERSIWSVLFINGLKGRQSHKPQLFQQTPDWAWKEAEERTHGSFAALLPPLRVLEKITIESDSLNEDLVHEMMEKIGMCLRTLLGPYQRWKGHISVPQPFSRDYEFYRSITFHPKKHFELA